MLASLIARTPYAGRPALVVAHPDDETIAAGGSLHLLPGLLLVHVTAGAPRASGDADRHGFPTPDAYAAAREAELQAALALSGADAGRHRLGLVDQEVVMHLDALTETLHRLFAQAGTTAVLTHAYEGGHPDHDATALATHAAAARLGIPVTEFAGYHAGPGGGTVVQRFLPGPAESLLPLAPADVGRKRAMLACFATQADIIGLFDPGIERMRLAARPDFTRAPHPGPLNYENWGWPLTGAVWRGHAGRARRCAA